jgi:hypothetical protein
MCHCDSRAGTGIRQPAEIVIASATPGILEIRSFLLGFLCDVERCRVRLKVVPGGQPGDEFFIGVGGFATQFVIEVHDVQNNSKFLAQFEKQEKERYGIRAAGYGYTDTVAGTDHSLALESREQLLVQVAAQRSRRFGS